MSIAVKNILEPFHRPPYQPRPCRWCCQIRSFLRKWSAQPPPARHPLATNEAKLRGERSATNQSCQRQEIIRPDSHTLYPAEQTEENDNAEQHPKEDDGDERVARARGHRNVLSCHGGGEKRRPLAACHSKRVCRLCFDVLNEKSGQNDREGAKCRPEKSQLRTGQMEERERKEEEKGKCLANNITVLNTPCLVPFLSPSALPPAPDICPRHFLRLSLRSWTQKRANNPKES